MKRLAKMARNKKVLEIIGVSMTFILLLSINVGKEDYAIQTPIIESEAFMETEDLTVDIEMLSLENSKLSLMQQIANEQTNQQAGLDVIEEETIIQEQTTTEGIENYSQNDLYWLSRVIMAEAEGASYRCKICTGLVVLNRIKSTEFPNTIYEVLFETGQYESVTNGRIYLEPNEDSIRAAKEILSGTTTISMPNNVVYQSKYEYLGSGIWDVIDEQYFNYE